MNERVTFRTMRLADYAPVRALWLRSPGVGLNEGDTRPAIARYLKRNPGLSYVAVTEGRIVGAVLCGHEARRGYLNHLAVDRAWQRRGIGRTLEHRCLAALRQRGVPKCNIFLYADNAAGARFWRAGGWIWRRTLVVYQRTTARAT